MIPNITVDATQALAKFGPSGIPEKVRNNLRRMLPALTKRIGADVEGRLDSGLKTRRTLGVKKEMVENPREIIGRVRVVYVGSDATKKMLPVWLDRGTKPHVIMAKNVPNLAFFWERMGRWFFGPKVNHPGFPGIQFMAGAVEQAMPDILDTMRRATIDGAK